VRQRLSRASRPVGRCRFHDHEAVIIYGGDRRPAGNQEVSGPPRAAGLLAARGCGQAGPVPGPGAQAADGTVAWPNGGGHVTLLPAAAGECQAVGKPWRAAGNPP
jgi:hypothetical protein